MKKLLKKATIEAALNKFSLEKDDKNELTDTGFEKIQQAYESKERRIDFIANNIVDGMLFIAILGYISFLYTGTLLYSSLGNTLMLMLPLMVMLANMSILNNIVTGKKESMIFDVDNKNINTVLRYINIIKASNINKNKTLSLWLLASVLFFIVAPWYIIIIQLLMMIFFIIGVGTHINNVVKAMIKAIN